MKPPKRKWIQKISRWSKTQEIHPDITQEDPTFQTLYSKCKPFSMTSIERMYALYKGIEYIVKNDIPGDIVECGVWKGGSAMMAAYALIHFGDTQRNIYLYDTYAGMTEPSKEDIRYSHDRQEAVLKWKQLQREHHNDWCYAPLEEVRTNLRTTHYPETRLIFVEGKVEETIPKHLPDLIALLRLDTDWYASTKHELIHLFPLLSRNGLLLIDDYGHWAGAKKATDEFFLTKPLFLARVDGTCRVAVKTSEGPYGT